MAEGSNTSITNPKPFVNFNDLKNGRQIPKYATLEGDYWWLDGTFENFPDEPSNIGYMSSIQSNDDGTIDITMMRTYDNNYASVGITFDFDVNVSEYPTDIDVEWYQDDTLLDSVHAEPDSASYFVAKNVTAFNKIVVTFNKMKSPNRYLKIADIYDGIVRIFYQNEISSAHIIEQIEIDNQALPSNELNISLVKPTDIALMFQRTLPFKLYKNEIFFGDFFIETSELDYRKTNCKIVANDYMNALETQTYFGGFYNNVSLEAILDDILGSIPYELDESLQSYTISGYMPAQNKRETLRQIAFSINAIVDDSRASKVRIKALPSEQKSALDDSRITEYKEIQDKKVTKIVLNTTTYVPNENVDELYNDNLNSTITLVFDAPHRNYTISGGTIIQSGTNYATIQGTGSNVTLSAKSYDAKTIQSEKDNTSTVTTDMTNILTYDTSLYSADVDILSNLQFVEKRINCTYKMEDEFVGDLVNINDNLARITSLSYSVVNGDIYAECEMEVYDEQT